MESPMNTSFFKISKEMERAASCSKMKGIYIYKGGQGNKNKYREEKNLYRLENRMQRMKRKTFTTSLRLRNYISSVSYTNLLGICAIAIIVNWYTSHLVQ